MTQRQHRSPIWKVSKSELELIIAKSNTTSEVLQHFGLMNKGGNYQTLNNRIEYDDIDVSELKKRSEDIRCKNMKLRIKIPLKQVLIENSTYNRSSLKSRLIKENIIPYVCSDCDMKTEWNGKTLVLILDHINGISTDNRLHNLRFLCPNCNSQQSTFAGRNYKRPKKKYFCTCGKEMNKKAILCKKCSSIKWGIKRRKVERPSPEQLKQEIQSMSWCAIGRKYNVSDRAIRKWAKSYGLK